MTLLTKEEKEFLKLSIKLSEGVVKKISLDNGIDTFLTFYYKDGSSDCSHYLKKIVSKIWNQIALIH